jgi:hypothetical protein
MGARDVVQCVGAQRADRKAACGQTVETGLQHRRWQVVGGLELVHSPTIRQHAGEADRAMHAVEGRTGAGQWMSWL